MTQAIWTGTVSFGLVNIPVRLYPAVRRKDVRFHELDRLTGQRVRHQRVREPLPTEPWAAPALPSPASGGANDVGAPTLPTLPPSPSRTGRGISVGSPAPLPSSSAVTFDEVVKGFEVAPNRYVAVDRHELEALEPERSRTIDIEQFVDLDQVDPLFFDASYYAVPSREHARSFGLLVDAMRRARRLALCWIVLRRKRHLAALRPYGTLLVLSTMLFADEILPSSEVEPNPPADLTAREREMAALLIATLSGPFEPERYRDEHRDRVLALIQGRAATARPAEPGPTSPAVADLMSALRASVEQVRAARKKTHPRPAVRRKRKSA